MHHVTLAFHEAVGEGDRGAAGEDGGAMIRLAMPALSSRTIAIVRSHPYRFTETVPPRDENPPAKLARSASGRPLSLG